MKRIFSGSIFLRVRRGVSSATAVVILAGLIGIASSPLHNLEWEIAAAVALLVIIAGVFAARTLRANVTLNVMVEASPNAMLLADERGCITLVNAQTEKLFGYSRGELLGQPIELLVPARFAAAHPRQRATFLAAPRAREMGAGRDLYGRRKDATEVPIEIGLSPITVSGRAFTLAAITDITTRRAAEDLDRFKAEVELSAAQLEAEREHSWSTAFQRAVLPVSLPDITGCRFDALYEPGSGYGQVGGDWYDAVHLIDGRILVSIGDVSGSGMNAAVVVGVVRQVMRGIAQLHANPNLILDAADRALCLEYSGVYVSAWVGLIDLVMGTLTYASAGHPPPLLVSRTGTIRELGDPTTLLIGLRDGHRGTSNIVELAQGDTLVLFTDGLIEATRDILAGLRTLHAAAADSVRAADPRPATAIRRHVIPHGASDDTAILVVRTDCAQVELHLTRWRFDVRDPLEAAAVRAEFVASLDGRIFSIDDRSCAEMVFGELIGNVVRHGGKTRRVDVIVDHRGPNSVLHVLDRGAGFQHIGRLPRDPYAESGRGLFLIDALTIDFTVSERPDGGSHARAVLRGGAANALTRPNVLPMTTTT